MSNHVNHLLAQWLPLKDKHKWVLGFIFKTEGSCYRKAGAMMLFSDAGHQLGILSGGCLESDIVKKAQRVMIDGVSRTAVYDDEDEEDIAFKLGVGCGGVVHLALVPVNKDNNYLSLDEVSQNLSKGHVCEWNVAVDGSEGACKVMEADAGSPRKAVLETVGGKRSLSVLMIPPIHILVVGGGYDATFMTKLASLQGYLVSLWDPRPAQARVEHFPEVNYLIDDPTTEGVRLHLNEHNIQAAVLMSHHREIDAKALQLLSMQSLIYTAMLGPLHRKQEIMDLAGLSDTNFTQYFASPAGFDIGGELPEHIALSVIAQCHAVFHTKPTHLKC
ncbi:xanthine and CO dehydrogenase family maturation factor XdhC/CoxF family protein [Alteromonas sp. KUL150]|uniref:XdhC family protein n=1 Tax=Alteromonas sp. KUL150 TaxID=2480805 RepID=UPI0012E446EC|nr:XdhC/CoxI family protein [Alteromonas sp. KUL150]GFD84560.1 xanthine and CO dehydrogenase family maturation factor XdhC/CoxF family protein [Alteromonas sp. KUL150]